MTARTSPATPHPAPGHPSATASLGHRLARRGAQAALGVAVLVGAVLGGASAASATTGDAGADTGVDAVSAAGPVASAEPAVALPSIPELGGAEGAGWFLAAGVVYVVAGGVLFVRHRRSAARAAAFSFGD